MSPTEVTERLSKLTPAARLKMQERLRGTAGASRIPRRAQGDTPRLSCAQERLWFLQQWDPASPLYNRPAAFRLKGALNYEALQRSLETVIGRHDALRGRYDTNDGLPQLSIGGSDACPLEILRLQPDEDLDAVLRREASRPFDLSAGCLLRARLIQVAERDHALLIVTHHIAADRWSDAVLYTELERVYGANGMAAEASVSPLPIQYSDYAAWQRSRLESEALKREQEYWTNQLRGAPHFLDLPADLPRPPEQSFAGATHRFTVGSAVVDSLRTLARAEGATLFVALLSAFAIVIRRWTERHEFIIGAPIAGRTRVETEALIGCFVNTLALRLDLSGRERYLDVLRSTRQTALDAYANAELPFERVIEAAAPQRNVSYSPLVQVMFALQNTPQRALALHRLDVEPLPLDTGTSKLDLSLEATETADGLSCALEFNTALFEPETIRRLASRWQMVLAAAAANPGVEIDGIPMVTPDEHRLLAAWNATDLLCTSEPVIHKRIEAAAQRTPDAVAVVADDGNLTYGELDRRANQVAHTLRSRGVGPGALVGVCIERSARLIVALTGVLKSGAAYVPLDPAYPDGRLAAVLAEARPSLVLCDAPLSDAMSAHAPDVIDVSAHREVIAQAPVTAPDVPVSSGDLAYVLFTSGSTGVPKGVMMPHGPVCNHIDWLQSAYPIGRDDRVLHHTSIGFDVSVGEIFGTLAAGATMVVAEPGGHRDPAYLAGLITTEKVTVIDVVPRMLQALLDEPGFANAHSLRQVHCGAEVMPPEIARRFLTVSDATLLNFYGPTEACIDVTVWRCDWPQDNRAIPIGRPIGNVHVHILDRDRRLVPIGQPGELYIGGAALARGYLHRPDLTAECFVPNPIDPDHSPLLYRTGDVARFRTDGSIEFLGRRDRQVKVRGMRIELAEIEAVIRQLWSISDCHVTLHQPATGQPQVVAYVEATTGQDSEAVAIREGLSRKLPSNMVPDIVVTLPKLPRTPGGKIDAAALPEPPIKRSGGTHDSSARSEEEQAIARIWSEVLNLGDAGAVGLDDDFFALGGHSLIAARMIARIRDASGVTLPLRVLFEARTVRGLAAVVYLQTAPCTASDSSSSFAVALHPRGSRPPFFFLHAATEGRGFYSEQLGRLLGPDQPYFSLAPLGLDGSAIPATVAGIAETYLRFVRQQQPMGPYVLGGFCVSGPVVVEMAHQLRAAGESITLVVVVESWVQNVTSRARMAERFVSTIARLAGLDDAARVNLFLKARSLAGWHVPAPLASNMPLPEHVRHHYYRACLAYAPQPSDIRLVHLRTLDRPGTLWGRVSSNFTEQIIPGDHNSCVTDHLGALAAAIKHHLEEAAPTDVRT